MTGTPDRTALVDQYRAAADEEQRLAGQLGPLQGRVPPLDPALRELTAKHRAAAVRAGELMRELLERGWVDAL